MTDIIIHHPTARYYDENYEDYATGWSEEHLHYGLWYESTKTHEESLTNTIQKAIDHLSIRSGDRVLDAGCGTGGTCRFIAGKCNCEVYGITLSNELLKNAVRMNQKMKHANVPKILIMDYHRTGFKRTVFTKILSIESMMAPRKKPYFKEMHRILRRRGKIAVIDFFLLKNRLNEEEKKIYDGVCKGWIASYITEKKFHRALDEQGFTEIRFEDLTQLIQKSSGIIHQAGRDLLPEVHAKTLKGELPESRLLHTVALYRQRECLERGILMYGIFSATKK